MKKIIIATLATVVLSGCASQVTTGKNVFITPSDSAHLSNCKLIGQVMIDTNVGGLWSQDEMRDQLKVELRDKAGEQYPNADTVAYSDLDFSKWSGDAQIMGTVFKCFNTK